MEAPDLEAGLQVKAADSFKPASPPLREIPATRLQQQLPPSSVPRQKSQGAKL